MRLGPWSDRIPVKEETPVSPLSSSWLPQRIQEKVAMHKPRREFAPYQDGADTLILVLHPQNYEEIHVCYLSHPDCGICYSCLNWLIHNRSGKCWLSEWIWKKGSMKYSKISANVMRVNIKLILRRKLWIIWKWLSYDIVFFVLSLKWELAASGHGVSCLRED